MFSTSHVFLFDVTGFFKLFFSIKSVNNIIFFRVILLFVFCYMLNFLSVSYLQYQNCKRNLNQEFLFRGFSRIVYEFFCVPIIKISNSYQLLSKLLSLFPSEKFLLPSFLNLFQILYLVKQRCRCVQYKCIFLVYNLFALLVRQKSFLFLPYFHLFKKQYDKAHFHQSFYKLNIFRKKDILNKRDQQVHNC